MKSSDQLNELFTALSAFQGEITNPAFDSKNPHFKNSYASLAGIRKHVNPVLAKHGLFVNEVLGANSLTVILGHRSGQYISSEIPLVGNIDKAQSYGSCTTYFRRYSVCALLGIAGEEDEDGEMNRKETEAKPVIGKARSAILSEMLSSEQKHLLHMKFQINELENIPADKYAEVLRWAKGE